VFGAMRDKPARRVLRHLAGAGLRPVFTAVNDPHARPPEQLLAAWRAIGGAGGAIAPDPATALERARAMTRGEEPVVVAGSLYLVGAIRGLLLGEEG